MFYIAICDDESCFRQSFQEYISNYLESHGISYRIDMFGSGEELFASGAEMTKYTVVFLDINMDGMDGVVTAQRIRSISKEIFIVFVTAYFDYALEGYKVDAARYLIKDSNQNNFQNTVNECMDSIIEKMNYAIVKKKFGFREGIKEISLERIIYIESNLHKLFFYVMEEELKVYTLYETLDEVEKKLEGNTFIRIHQSYLANLKYIKNILRYNAILYDGTELIIPKARYMRIKEAFIAYQGEV
ncbi:MAG: LytTR family DNA-binding domain-containing protein [Roseburia sp.]|nr:LytTR family DNA-binding domain-containing protein [Roseburia sp.]